MRLGLDNVLITIWDGSSSSKYGLANSPIDLAVHHERSILLNVNQVNLDILALDVDDGKRLLPVHDPMGIAGT